MHKAWKVIIVLVLAALVAWVLVQKPRGGGPPAARAGAGEGAAAADATLPRLLEIGGPDCLPCKEMKQVLASLEAHYPGQLRIEFVNFWLDEETADRYDVLQIPTQIFLDPAGKVLGRNEGPITEQALVAKWKELGYDLRPTDAPGAARAETPPLMRLFEAAKRFLGAAPAVALAAAFAWGILSVLLSPCQLASIPLIVGFISSQGPTTTRRAFLTSGVFALGILATFALIGGITAAAGRVLGNVGAWANYAVAAVFLAVGLLLLDVIPMPGSGLGQMATKRRGLPAAFLLGLVFAVAIGPCAFVFLAPVLLAVLQVAKTALAYGILLLVVYGIGNGAVIIAAGTSTNLVQRYLNWNERSKGVVAIKRACGVLVAFAGLYLLYTAR